MFKIGSSNYEDKEQFYKELAEFYTALVEGDSDWLAGIANGAALLYQLLPEINWAGFYLFKEGQLVLGPFQGKPACIRIQLGKGVCGTAAKEGKTRVVPDVHLFPGHIACDEASRSEIVVPVLLGERLIGVLDIDSPVPGRFDREDARGLEKLVEIINQHLQWPEKFC